MQNARVAAAAKADQPDRVDGAMNKVLQIGRRLFCHKPDRCSFATLRGRAFGLFIITVSLATGGAQSEFSLTAQPPAAHSGSTPALTLDTPAPDLWAGRVGNGFRKAAMESGVALGVGWGDAMLGGQAAHDFALSKLHLGRMLSGVLEADHWYRGNVELVGELFGGQQIRPEEAYVIGITPLLRYNFATGTRCVPFVEGGAGITLTDVSLPDLSTTFEFNVQGGIGAHWFFSPRVAATAQCRFLHISNAKIKLPNHGVNTTMFYGGITWFF